MAEKFIISGAPALVAKLALAGKPYSCKTLGRSVAAGNITAAQAQKHNNAYEAFAARRKAAKQPLDAPGYKLAKPKAESTPATPKVTAAALKRMNKAELIALLAS